MTCTVLLVDTFSSFRVETGLIYPSFITGQMTGFLEQENISFDVIFAVPQDEGEIDVLIDNQLVSKSFQKVLEDVSPKIVAFFPEPELIPPSLVVLEQARRILPDSVFVAGMNSGITFSDQYLKRGIDYICGQDLYASFVNLTKDIMCGKSPEEKIYSCQRKYEDMNSFPFISKRFFDHMRPQWCFPSGEVLPFGIINDSIGCTGGCAHCPNSSFWGTDWIAMDAHRIYEEMKFQMDLLGVKTFLFSGINFFPNSNGELDTSPHIKAAQRISELDRLFTENNLDIKFINTVRPDTVNYLAQNMPDLLDRFLDRVSICFLGIESFSETVLKGLNKKITCDMIRSAVQLIKDKNIMIIASFIVGGPWETHETLKETEDFIANELPSSCIPILNIMTPYPGTRFYEDLNNRGLIVNTDISCYNGKHLVFKHPVFKPGELEEHVQTFYYRFFMEQFSG
jgi:radical SAM superfamily enzyme YgiQ (UPF0313 family)